MYATLGTRGYSGSFGWEHTRALFWVIVLIRAFVLGMYFRIFRVVNKKIRGTA